MAISQVGGAVGTTSATLPTHQAGDVILCFAFRDGSTTAPTLPAGWVNLGSGGANTCSWRLAYRRATAAGTASGTWTNASRVSFLVLRGTWAEHPFGTISTTQNGTATSVTYPANNPRKIDSTSWLVAFAGHRSVNTTLETAPTGFTNVAAASGVDTIAETACHTDSTISGNFSATAVAVGGTASGWSAAVVEILADPPSGAVENHIYQSGNTGIVAAGSAPPGVLVEGGTLSVTGAGTESSRKYIEYRWQYTNGTGADDFPSFFIADYNTPAASTPGYPGDVIAFSFGIRTVSGTAATSGECSCPSFQNNGSYIGENGNLTLSTAGLNSSTITNVAITGTAPANSVQLGPRIAATVPAAGTFDWTFRLFEPQLEFGVASRSSTFVETNTGADFTVPSTGPSGTLATTDLPDATSAAGTVANVATLASTDRPDAAAITALNAAFGALDSTDRPDASAIAGTVANQGTLATTDLPDVAASSGTVANQAVLATTDLPDVAAVAGTVANVGSLATTDRPDSASIAAFHAAFGTLDTTDRPDSAAVSGLVENQAVLATTDRPDSAVSAGTVDNRAALATTDRPDAASGAGTVENVGSLATTDRPDAASVAALVENQSALATTDRPDSAAMAGTVLSGISAVLATTDRPDSAAVSGQLNVFGSLATTDRPDSVAAAAQVLDTVFGPLSGTEAPDGVAILAWTYPWHEALNPQTNPWLPGSTLSGTWTDVLGPLSSMWSPNAGPNDTETWTDRPGTTTYWE